MDIHQPNLQNHAYYLRSLMKSIGDLNEFAHFVIPNDNEAAGLLLCSFLNIQSKLELWTENNLPDLCEQDGFHWAPNLLQPSGATGGLDSETLDSLQLWDPDLICSSISSCSTIFDLTTANGHDFNTPARTMGYNGGSCFTDSEPLLTLPDSPLPSPLESASTSCHKEMLREHMSSYFFQKNQKSLQNNMFKLKSTDAANRLLFHLADMVYEDGFQNHVHIEDLPTFSLDSIATKDQVLSGYTHHGITYKMEYTENLGRYACLFTSDNTFDFRSPIVQIIEEPPPSQSCPQFLESLVEEVSRIGSVSCLVGPPLDERWSAFVDSGEELKSQLPGDAQGIATPHWHLGSKFSGAAFRKEDCDLRAMSLVLHGYKLWLIVDSEDTEKFESWIRKTWGGSAGNDDQWVSHLSLILPPSMLEMASIKFRLIYSGPGDLVITSPNQYYYMINMTSNLALTNNFLFPGEFIAKQQILLCEKCAIYPFIGRIQNISAIPAQEVTTSQKRPFIQPNFGRAEKRRRGLKAVDLAVNVRTIDEEALRVNIIKKLQAPPNSCLVPLFSETNPPRAKIIRLAMAMRGYNAIAQIWGLWKNCQNERLSNLGAALIDRKLSGNTQQAALDQGIAICTGTSQRLNLLRRVLTWHFAEVIEQSKGPAAIRASSAIVNHYVGESSKSRYSKLKYRGDLLHMICGSHRGLLPFIPLQREDGCGIRDPESQYQYSATKSEFKEFERIFEVNDIPTRVFCAIGTSFLDSWCYKDPVDFKYNGWLSELQQDFSLALIQRMANDLDQDFCGCGKK